MERVATELLRTLGGMDEKLDAHAETLGVVREKAIHAEQEIGKLRAFQERVMARRS
jgi:hypothetical protein